MSTQSEILRLQEARNKIRNKLVALTLAGGEEKLDEIADIVDNIENNGSIDAEVKEGESYPIPKGFHDGKGVVKGVAGGGNYKLQPKTVTPEKQPIIVTPDEGSYGLSSVTVEAIPKAYQDVTSVTATEDDVLANKIIVDADGNVKAGTMPNNGAVEKTLDVDNPSYTVDKGYHNGEGTVSIELEEKSATPTKTEQEITPTSGKVLSKVTVAAIPDEYITTDDATAKAEHILLDETAYVNGVEVVGTMPNNGAITEEIDGLTVDSYTIPAGYTSGGKVSLSSAIEDALAAI